MLVVRADVFRSSGASPEGYLVGSGWKEYQQTGEVCGKRWPAG